MVETVVEGFLILVHSVQHRYVSLLTLPDLKQVSLFALASFRDEQIINLKEIHQKEDFVKLF